MQKNKLYLFILIACFAGYMWLFFSSHHQIQNNEFTVCFFKKTTNIPCPACGTTRAILEISKGNLLDAMLLNPFGIVVALIMVIGPIWILSDFIFKKDTFYKFYKKTELFLSKKTISIPLIILVIVNWIWNINKNL